MKTNETLSPRWARRLLRWFHPEETLEEVEGDLDELYAYWYQRAGKQQAFTRRLAGAGGSFRLVLRRALVCREGLDRDVRRSHERLGLDFPGAGRGGDDRAGRRTDGAGFLLCPPQYGPLARFFGLAFLCERSELRKAGPASSPRSG